jgi:hypothetical protein
VGCVAPWVGLCLLLATRPASDINDVAWGFWIIPLSAVGSFVLTALMAARARLTFAEGIAVAFLGLVASGAAFVLGVVGWIHAADLACHGRYECPF